jgi:hypothetical protein
MNNKYRVVVKVKDDIRTFNGDYKAYLVEPGLLEIHKIDEVNGEYVYVHVATYNQGEWLSWERQEVQQDV